MGRRDGSAIEARDRDASLSTGTSHHAIRHPARSIQIRRSDRRHRFAEKLGTKKKVFDAGRDSEIVRSIEGQEKAVSLREDEFMYGCSDGDNLVGPQ